MELRVDNELKARIKKDIERTKFRSILSFLGKDVIQQILVAADGMDLATLVAWMLGEYHDNKKGESLFENMVALGLIKMLVTPDNVVTLEMNRLGVQSLECIDPDAEVEAIVAPPVIYVKFIKENQYNEN